MKKKFNINEIVATTIKEYMDSLNNEQGLVVYHGTNDNSLNIEDIKPDFRLKGLYTTTDKRAAKDYMGRGGKIFSFKLKPTAEILDLGDGGVLYDWMKNEGLLDVDDFNDVDLENYIIGGRIFQYDFSSGTHLADDIMSTAKSEGYDVVILTDDLRGYGDDLAYVILNMNAVTPIDEVNI